MDTPARRCPCGSGDGLDSCCGPILDGDRGAATAEQLMRSRYTAFCLGDGAHLHSSWHPRTRPSRSELDASIEAPVRWLHLEILDHRGGGPFEDEGTVEFRATSRSPEGRSVMHEVSDFVREGGRWFYVEGRHP